MPKLIYVDSGVLLAAMRGPEQIARRAFSVLDDGEAQFASSIFVRLEILPKALHNRRMVEARFYETFFETVAAWAVPNVELIEQAYANAVVAGLSAMDALHITAAMTVGAAELVTIEKPTSPLCRCRLLPVRTIAPAD